MRKLSKKTTEVFIILIMIIMTVTALPSTHVHAANKDFKTLKEGVVYSINLNGGKTKEKVKWTATGSYNNYTFKLFVNGKAVYKKKYSYALSCSVSSFNLDTSDKYKELIVRVAEASHLYVDCFILRYKNSKTVKRYSYSGEKITREPVPYSRISKNKFYMTIDTPFENDNFGNYYVRMPFMISGNKIKRAKAGSYKYGPLLYGISTQYRLKRSMILYKTASRKNFKASLYSGTEFKPLYVKPGNKHVTYSQSGNYGYTLVRYDLYVKVKTDTGLTGWLYFPAQANDYMGDYLANRPGWS